MSQQIDAGEVFTDTSPGKTVTAPRLNNHVNGATLLNGAVIDQGALARVITENDWILVGDNTLPDTAAPAKVAVANLLPESIRNQSHNFALASSANPATVYAVTLAPAATAYTAGMVVVFRADHVCAANAQINVNAIGAVNLLKYGGTQLNAGDLGLGQVVEVVYDAVLSAFQIISPLTSTPVAAIQGDRLNLLAFNDAGTPTTKVDISADALMLLDASNNSFLARGVSLIGDITASGANGLDTGSPANSTWYYLWVIYNSALNTVAALISTSASTPTMPGGYTFKALVGAVFRGSGGTFNNFYQQDKQVFIPETVLFTAKAVVTGGTYESYQAGGGGSDVDLRTLVPPNAKRLSGMVGGTDSTAVILAGDANGTGAQLMSIANIGVTFDTFAEGSNFLIPLITAQKFFWKCVNTNARNRVCVTGYAL